jgi:hypothetical protein
MPGWSIALAIGLSFTKPSDVKIDMPADNTHVTLRDVHWSGKPFVSPLYYVVRIGYGDAAIDFTHYKIEAAVHKIVHEDGTWHGAAVDDDVTLNERVQHFEVSHGVNSLALVGILHDPSKRGLYIGGGPVIYLSHSESTIDGKDFQWGYGHSGNGAEVFAGDGIPAPWTELKFDAGQITVKIADGTATVPLNTVHISVAP